MIYPDDFKELISDLRVGLNNSVLYDRYAFNAYVGIKTRKNKDNQKIDAIIITWNREKSLYDNDVDLVNELLTYIGAGLNGKQVIGRQNTTLINYFKNNWDIPVLFCSKIGKKISYISMLKQSSTIFEYPDGKDNHFKFYFKMYDIDYKNLNNLLNIIPNKKVPWDDSKKNKVDRKRNSIKRVIEDQKLRDLLKELQFIGDMGELLVMAYEYSRLKSIGLDSYVDQIEHTATSKGHGLGYDIKSFDYNNITKRVEEIYIEVKTTKLSSNQSFEMTKNEYETMHQKKEQYRIYRVYEIYEKEDTIDEYKYPFTNLNFVKKNRESYMVNPLQ